MAAASRSHRAAAGKESRKPRRPSSAPELLDAIRHVADQLEADHAHLGDLKLLARALKELRYAFKVFAPYRNLRKVTVFGSARTAADHPAYHQAVSFGRALAERGWMVITGAASGIMEAGHVGAGRERSMGLNILLPFEQGNNRIIEGDNKLVHLRYFFTRKLLFLKECHAIALFPGGFGTLDEGFEALTLLQTGKAEPRPIVCIDEPGGGYWRAFDTFVREQLLERRLVSPPDPGLYHICRDVDDAVGHIERFYRVYHSMRYVGKLLVLRLNRPIPRATVEALSREFADIRDGGEIELRAAFPAEREERELAHLPRLAFRFNRHSLGRLRCLIDAINAAPEVDEARAGGRHGD